MVRAEMPVSSRMLVNVLAWSLGNGMGNLRCQERVRVRTGGMLRGTIEKKVDRARGGCQRAAVVIFAAPGALGIRDAGRRAAIGAGQARSARARAGSLRTPDAPRAHRIEQRLDARRAHLAARIERAARGERVAAAAGAAL